jgi:hypothetical protein
MPGLTVKGCDSINRAALAKALAASYTLLTLAWPIYI